MIDIMEEASADGLSGDPLWQAVEAKMHSRGLNRKIGGARNRWMRGLREATRIDERRKKNARKTGGGRSVAWTSSMACRFLQWTINGRMLQI